MGISISICFLVNYYSFHKEADKMKRTLLILVITAVALQVAVGSPVDERLFFGSDCTCFNFFGINLCWPFGCTETTTTTTAATTTTTTTTTTGSSCSCSTQCNPVCEGICTPVGCSSSG